MRLMIKQRVFSWGDTYDIYDEYGNAKYVVKSELLAIGHHLYVFDSMGTEVGQIHQKLFCLTPQFDIVVNGNTVGNIVKKFTLFRPQYEVNCKGWRVEGDFLGWDYHVYEASNPVIHITKQWLNWGDTYVIDFANPKDEIMGLLLVVAIDAANCSQND